MAILFVLFSWLALADEEDVQVPEIASIEKEILDYRRSMKQGHVVFKQKSLKNGVYDPRRESVTTVWFDGKKLRNDDLSRYTDEPENAPAHLEKVCRNCEKDGYWLYYNDKQFPEGELGVSMTNMATNPNPEVFDLVHPQRLGMVPEPVANLATSRAHLESFVARSDRKNASIRRVRWKKLDCLQIFYQLPDTPDYGANACVRIWISPHQGPSVTRIEAEWNIQSKHYVDSVESDLRQFMPSGLWYPQTVVYERRIDGESIAKEMAEVEVLSLNEPIPSRVFTLAGFDLPANKPVYVIETRGHSKNGRGKNGYRYWNGEKLVPKSDLQLPISHRSSNRTRQWLFVASAVFFALTAVGLFWRWWRRGKPPLEAPSK